MRILRHFLLMIAVLGVAGPILAQEIVQRTAVPEADELAGEMHALAANPLDLDALIRAGELTLDMGDTTAAAGFFARAERIDPRNGRIKAGLGGLLLMAERPGEALRRFAEAEALGRDPLYYAAGRGLAFDLVGQQERAQRDYRLALKTAPDDETVRRYALSLGISGQRDQALEQIDSLLRKSDRGAWRSRAFILAMTGDAPGASRIAASMMPAGMGQGLDPFFARLAQLGPADRAFAVHFGEVRATPQRLADARLAPSLPVLSPEPGRQQIAASATPAAPIDAKAERRAAKRKKRDRGNVQLATITPAPPVSLPLPPTYVVRAAPEPQIAALPTTQAPIALAARETAPVPRQTSDVTPAMAPPTPTPTPVTVQPITPAPEETVRVAATPQRPPVSEDSILARIVASITIPGSELAPARPVETAAGEAWPSPLPSSLSSPDPAIAAADRKLADKKAAADKKALADRKVLADKKAADKKAADIARADPARIWVQVAGGANEATLPKEWAKVRDKAPDAFRGAAFKGKSGWTTPLRATNRVLAGPFKSNEEARTFVNLIAKSGVSGFAFTSEAGQKITKLPVK